MKLRSELTGAAVWERAGRKNLGAFPQISVPFLEIFGISGLKEMKASRLRTF